MKNPNILMPAVGLCVYVSVSLSVSVCVSPHIQGDREWLSSSGYMLAWSVIRRLMCSCQLSSLSQCHVDNSLANCESLTCFSQCLRLVQPKPRHVLSWLCDNACKRSPAISRMCIALCSISRLLSVSIWPTCAEQGL